MRILVLTQFRRKVGGAESYLEVLLPALQQRGHEVAICYQVEGPEDRPQLNLPREIREFLPKDSASVLEQIGQWNPAIIFCQGISDLEFEAQILKLAPGIFYAHNYQCTCISGAKTRSFPQPAPCQRIFGAGCLLEYFPRRCGGLNPATMLKRYRDQYSRLESLQNYVAIATNSEYLAHEYRRHGLNAQCLYLFAQSQKDISSSNPSECRTQRLLFAGRMDRLKGGDVLLEALPNVMRAGGAELQLTFAGDGPERSAWQQKAARIEAAYSGIHVRFKGWLDKPALEEEFLCADVLVVPSLWPEPFGLVGLEAGLYGVPAAAFAVGGIPEWLCHGENGYLAPGHAPQAAALAEAITRTLDPADHGRLRAGARKIALRWTVERHCRELESLFEIALKHNLSHNRPVRGGVRMKAK